jgi:hypothetical protein
MATRRPVRLVQSEVWLGRAEFEDLIRQREPEAIEATRYPSAGTKDIEVRPLITKPPRVSEVAPLFSPVPTIVEEDGLIRLDDLEPAPTERPSSARSRRCTRWTAAGVLGAVVLGGAVSVPLLTSGGGAPRVAAGKAAPAGPVAVLPVPDPSNNRGSEPAEAVQPAPVAAPNPPAAVTVHSEPAEVPASHTARSDNRSITRPKHAGSPTTPTPDNQAAMDDPYQWWSQAAARNPRWTQYFGPESAPLASADWSVEPGRQSHR